MVKNITKKRNFTIRVSDKVYDALLKKSRREMRSLSSLGELILTTYYNEKIKKEENNVD